MYRERVERGGQEAAEPVRAPQRAVCPATMAMITEMIQEHGL